MTATARDIFGHWRLAIPLADAREAFASKKLRAEINAPISETDGNFQKLILSLPEVPDLPPGTKEQMVSTARGWDFSFAKAIRRGQVLRKMEHELIGGLTAEKFIAIGYAIPRKARDYPGLIPNDLFRPQFFKFEESRIRGNGLEFVEVRIAKRARGSLKGSFPNLPTTPARIGRPSMQLEIRKAFSELTLAGKIPPGMPQKPKFDLIKSKVRKNNPTKFGESNLSDKTIRRALQNC